MTKLEKLKELGSGTQNGVWIESGDCIITNIDFDNGEITTQFSFTASCGCCTDLDFENESFESLDSDMLDDILKDFEL
jgi:hypothetical protein